ncbi:MAG: UvrD-helicase domain-containing protein, partial [Dehalococcoidia bacterium]|nr:UvrD-helicase domain-containing protein [Dehalococcoidia bacterium]
MPANAIGHEAISASAGSGKTFELAHRYIGLLARGVAPESIVALTFSRKAAGEISDSIVRYLCDAASTEVEAQHLAQRIRTPGISQAHCLSLLRTFIERLHLIHLGTLDSFTAGILRSFPFELGIPPGFQLMESGGAVALEMQQQVMEQMSLRSRNAVGQAIRQASYGRSNKRVEEIAGEFVSEHQPWIRVLPEAGRWGTRSVIWPHGTPWLDAPLDVETAADALEGFLSTAGWTIAATEKWMEFVAAARRYGPYSRWDRRIDFIFKKLVDCRDALLLGTAEVKLNRTSCPLEGDVARSVMTLMQHLVRTDLETALKRTQGIHRLLSIYEEQYDAAMRREGRLSFIDAQYLLTEANRVSGGAVLSRTQGSPTRLYIDYRLDARLDHWLLDEFQDTSDLQWQALENLIDEVVQDASGSRSLFYVGDVKQAIYGWRGGNPRLFQTLIERYGDAIEQRSLKHSHRSCQAIIDTVNRVFGRTAETDLPRAAVSLWERFWETHECAAGVPQNGCAMVIEPSCDGGERTPAPEDRHHTVARLLQQLQPLARGLSTAVLVRTNDQGRAVVDCLRTECPQMTVVHEGVAAIKDNPVVALLLSLVTFAAHPGDTLAWRHIQMSPLHGILDQLHLDGVTLSTRILKEVQSHGYQQTLRDWGARLERAAALDAFGRIRLAQLLEAAGEFDSEGGMSCDEFLSHIDHFELRDAAADDAIRVMTVHQSKGLGFDVVILPELERQSMTAARNPKFVLARDERTQTPRWALKLPRRAVAECDETVRAEIERADSNASFESLCVLYVAMTRAKKGL